VSATTFEELKAHVGHKLECVTYGNPPDNVAVECLDCSMVIVDFDSPPDDEGTPLTQAV
jgi:hypothetical protein